MHAIQAGTSLNVELLGWEHCVGSLEVAGRLADLVAVPAARMMLHSSLLGCYSE